jgi:hypothetical protein
MLTTLKSLRRKNSVLIVILVVVCLFSYLFSYSASQPNADINGDIVGFVFFFDYRSVTTVTLSDYFCFKPKFHQKIDNLESNLNKLNKNVNDLSNLMNSALKSLNNELQIVLAQGDKVKAEDVTADEKIAILVLACNRPMSIESHLDQLIK